ncbi:MAG: methyltransferase domain-containing protein [Lentisphaerae bacterium]|nr:methyltransferase domain-containing protein [Lentisphaerota bacterium]
MNEMERWESEEGVHFLKRIGIQKGNTVADFGARIGHYAIPAAILVGAGGTVYALDKNAEALVELQKKSAVRDASNIITIETTSDTGINLPDQSIDALLIYDVLHMIPEISRSALYKEVARVLKNSGFLSIYPKHVAEDDAEGHFKNLTAEDVAREVSSAGFITQNKICGKLSHGNTLVSGCVWNFVKIT